MTTPVFEELGTGNPCMATPVSIATFAARCLSRKALLPKYAKLRSCFGARITHASSGNVHTRMSENSGASAFRKVHS